jgi:SH3 domain-containing YSC84-like protein 1
MLCDTLGRESKDTRSKVFSCLLMSTLAFLLALPAYSASQYKDETTLRDAANVLTGMFGSDSIPQGLVRKADCIIVLPNVKKFSVGIGGTGGRGPMTCRHGQDFSGKWSAPAMYSLSGASVGLQLGGTSTDFVLLVMDQKGVDAILRGTTKLGRDATAAAGPGATAASAAGNDILTYARSKGLFAGVSLGGASLDADTDANKRIYGQDVSAQSILREGTVKTTDAGKPLVSLLNSKITS